MWRIISLRERAAHDAGQSTDQTLLWAPQFLPEEDAEAHHLPKSRSHGLKAAPRRMR
jgi:hypothetical protein